jgi:hypothetical protein
MRGFVPSAILARVASGHAAWLAEFRRVTTLFIKLPPVDMGGSSVEQSATLAVLQARVLLLMEECYTHRGDVRQLITDDKGMVMILLFGLQADWANPLLGVQAALSVSAKMKAKQLGSVAIGVTTGPVFCGTVGNTVRCEYTVVGDKVNTAARLMAAVPHGDGIYVDADTVEAVSRKPSSRIAFRALRPIELKGKAEPVPIFVPVTHHVHPSRVSLAQPASPGRRGSILAARQTQRENFHRFLSHPAALHFNRVYIEAASHGMGKSLFVQWAVEACERRGHRVLFCQAEELDATPNFAFHSLVPSLLQCLWELHPARVERAPEDDEALNQSLLESSAADWLRDPTSLSLPEPLKADPTSLQLLHSLCPSVHFERSASARIAVRRPPLTAASGLPTQPISPLPSAATPPPLPSPQLREKQQEAVKGADATSVLDLLSSLLSHAHLHSRHGCVVLVDEAQWLDSASEEALLSLSQQVPAVRFIFTATAASADGAGPNQPQSEGCRRAETSTLRTRLIDCDSMQACDEADASGLQQKPSNRRPLPTYFIHLCKFDQRELAQLLQAELDCTEVDSAVTTFILEKSCGIPLFVLELTRQMMVGNLLQLTTEARVDVDKDGRIPRHAVSTQHIETVKQQRTYSQQRTPPTGTSMACSPLSIGWRRLLDVDRVSLQPRPSSSRVLVHGELE